MEKFNSADIDSDHFLLDVHMVLPTIKKNEQSFQDINVDKLMGQVIVKSFKIKIRRCFLGLLLLDSDINDFFGVVQNNY